MKLNLVTFKEGENNVANEILPNNRNGSFLPSGKTCCNSVSVAALHGILVLKKLHTCSSLSLSSYAYLSPPSKLPMKQYQCWCGWMQILPNLLGWNLCCFLFFRQRCSEAWGTFLNMDRPEHHSINRLKERGVEKGSGWHSTLHGWERSTRQILALFQGQSWGDCWELGRSMYGPFRALQCHFELKLKQTSGHQCYDLHLSLLRTFLKPLSTCALSGSCFSLLYKKKFRQKSCAVASLMWYCCLC